MNASHGPVFHLIYLNLMGELRDFQNAGRTDKPLVVPFHGNPALKDTIESVGVPHVEIGSTLIGDKKISLDTRLYGGETVHVRPRKYVYREKPGDTEAIVQLPDPPAFILDVHLGKLTVKMRMAGIDTDYQTHRGDAAIVDKATAENRIVLTRDIGLLKHRRLVLGRWIRAEDPLQQWIEVMRLFRLWHFLIPGTRCTRCNHITETVAFEKISGRLPERVRARRPEVKQCPACGHLYWQGTHFRHYQEELETVIATARGRNDS